MDRAAWVRDSGAALEEGVGHSLVARPHYAPPLVGASVLRFARRDRCVDESRGRSRQTGRWTGFPLLLLLTLHPGCASVSLEPIWVVVTSPRFEIYSTLSAEDSHALINELEQIHELIGAVTNAPLARSGVPTRIFAFAKESQYASLGSADTAGFFMPGLRNNWILISGGSRDIGAGEIVLHEYVHQVLRTGTSRSYPLWYDEGMAELFSSVHVRGDHLAIGSVPERSVSWFQYGEWLPFDRVVSARTYADIDVEQKGMFYAQAWALVHYLTLDREPGRRSIGQSMSRYLDLLELGIEPGSAFQDAFGESPVEAGINIRRVLFNRRIKIVGYPVAKLAFDRSEVATRPARSGEVELRMGELRLARGDASAAEKEFRAALAIDPDSARANAGLGNALKQQSRIDEAEMPIRRAVALDPADPLNQLDLAAFHIERAIGMLGPIEAIGAELATARIHLEKAIQLDGSRVEAWAMLGASYLAPGEDASAALGHLERAIAMHPSSATVLSLLAEAHLARGDELRARDYLTRMIAARGDVARGYSVDEVIARLRKRRDDVARRERTDRSSMEQH